ncbi:PDZ domain-containing protein [Virgibacillus kekensis]|uniref:PDZ domain-containing protein n=1 Tax=Virgibacillus kekensis TaxID=202261 RepID=A0ABV9DGK9_9BACI
MAEAWLIEIAKGFGKFFMNPVFYWAIILTLLAGYSRIRRERMNFGLKLFDVFSEWKNTLVLSMVSGLVISLLFVGVGFVFSYTTILILCAITILLSLTLRFTMLSPSYTIGITYIALLFLPLIPINQSLTDWLAIDHINFIGISLLLAVLLTVEALLLKRNNRSNTFPDLERGRRGSWMGTHHLKKLSIIPFFILVPSGALQPIAPFWPYFSMNGETFSLILVPFLLGFDYTVRGSLPEKASARIARSIHILSLVVLLLALGSIYAGWLSLCAVAVAIIGREYINYQHRVKDQQKTGYFNRNGRGLKVLGIIPGTPADRLGILAGESIVKVNSRKTDNMDEFYLALQESGAFFKLEIIGDNGELRFVQGAIYEEDHHELGIITADHPHKEDESRAN